MTDECKTGCEVIDEREGKYDGIRKERSYQVYGRRDEQGSESTLEID